MKTREDFEKMARDYTAVNAMDAYRYGGEDEAIPNLTGLLIQVHNDAVEASLEIVIDWADWEISDIRALKVSE